MHYVTIRAVLKQGDDIITATGGHTVRFIDGPSFVGNIRFIVTPRLAIEKVWE